MGYQRGLLLRRKTGLGKRDRGFCITLGKDGPGFGTRLRENNGIHINIDIYFLLACTFLTEKNFQPLGKNSSLFLCIELGAQELIWIFFSSKEGSSLGEQAETAKHGE